MDCMELKCGDIDPLMGKKIKEIIFCSNTCIVYMDEHDVIQWATTGHNKYGNNFGKIANQISYWESICNNTFSKKESYDFKSILAEGYARMLDEGNDSTAQKIIDQVSDRIKKHGKEILRQQYVLSSLVATIIVITILLISIYFRKFLVGEWSNNIFIIYITSLFGGIGAFISTVARSKTYASDVAIGKNIHRVDGVLRIILGIIAGAVIAIGIKSNIVFGFVNSIENYIFGMAFLGSIGGASETIIPSIIKQVEKNVELTI